mmetsp:Transcript_13976/g.34497  ORF Transcript_13976/g.34497 Transcript_13976/m.34497 type:complete len:222 (+) Transcript_13976:2448-3113(+)
MRHMRRRVPRHAQALHYAANCAVLLPLRIALRGVGGGGRRRRAHRERRGEERARTAVHGAQCAAACGVALSCRAAASCAALRVPARVPRPPRRSEQRRAARGVEATIQVGESRRHAVHAASDHHRRRRRAARGASRGHGHVRGDERRLAVGAPRRRHWRVGRHAAPQPEPGGRQRRDDAVRGLHGRGHDQVRAARQQLGRGGARAAAARGRRGRRWRHVAR